MPHARVSLSRTGTSLYGRAPAIVSELPEQEVRLTNRSLALLVAGLVTFGMGFSLLFAVLPPLGRELGFREIQVGAIFAVAAVFLFLFSPVWGRKSDQYGRKRILLAGFLGFAITQAIFVGLIQAGLIGLMSISLVFPLLLLARAAFAAMVAAVNPSATGYIADTTTPEQRTAKLAWVNASFGIGSMIGPSVGALLSGFGLLVPLYAICVWALIMAYIIWWFLPEPPQQNRETQSVRLKFSDRRVLPIAVVTTGAFFALGANMQLAAFFVQDRLGLTGTETSQYVGTLLTVMAIAALAAQLLIVGKLRWHPLSFLLLGLPVGTVAMAGLAMSDNFPGLLAFFLILGVAIGIAGPAINGAASLAVTPQEQGGVAGIIEASRAVGFFVAAMGGAALYEIASSLPYWLMTGVLATVSLYAFYLWFRWRRTARRQ